MAGCASGSGATSESTASAETSTPAGESKSREYSSVQGEASVKPDRRASENKKLAAVDGGEGLLRNQSAPAFGLRLPEGWKQLSPGEVNPNAEFAGTNGESFYAMVIAAETNAEEGAQKQVLAKIQESFTEQLHNNLTNLSIQEERDEKIDGAGAKFLSIQGAMQGRPVQYVALLNADGGWGYQIVLWGPANAEEGLEKAAEAFGRGWRFPAAEK